MQGFIKEDSVPFFDSEAARLVTIAATTASALPAETFASNLQDLLLLVPGFEARLQRIRPQLLAALVCDTGRVADGLVRLKELFPTADVAKLVCRRYVFQCRHNIIRTYAQAQCAHARGAQPRA